MGSRTTGFICFVRGERLANSGCVVHRVGYLGGRIYFGGRGKVTFHVGKLFTNVYPYSVIFLALVSVLYISAMFLTYYAAKAEDNRALEIVRKYALFWSAPTILASLFVFYAIQDHNAEHFNNMITNAWMFILSFLFFLIAVYLVWKRRNYGWAFLCVVLQFGFAWFGYGASHLPYVLYPYVNIYDSFTNPAMATALIAVFILGLLVLIRRCSCSCACSCSTRTMSRARRPYDKEVQT